MKVCETSPGYSFLTSAVTEAFGKHIPTSFGRCNLAVPLQVDPRPWRPGISPACTPSIPHPCSSFAISSDVHGSPFIASMELPKLKGRRPQAALGDEFTIRFCKSNSDCGDSGFCAGERAGNM